jgi:hypothetical protein
VRINITLAAVSSVMRLGSSASGQGATVEGDGPRTAVVVEERPQWLYFDVEGGGVHASVRTFFVNQDSLSVSLREVTADGPMIGLGGGFRFSIVTLGPRFRYAPLDEFKLLSGGGELGIRIPISIVEPHLDLGAGYVGMSGGTSPDREKRPFQAHGYYGRIAGGIDVKLTRVLSVGFLIGWEYMGVVPDGISVSSVSAIQTALHNGNFQAVQNEIKKAEGTSFGSLLTYGVRFGLHY